MNGARATIAVVTVIAAAWSPATAGAQAPSLAINPYLGYYAFDESSFEDAFEGSDVDGDLLAGVRLVVGDRSGWSLDIGFGQASVSGEIRDGGEAIEEDATVRLLYGAADWHLPLPGPLDVFLSGGGGLLRYDADGRDAVTDVLLNYGAGASIPVGPVRVRADAKDHLDLCDAPEDVGAGEVGACLADDTLHNIELSIGIEIAL